MSNLNEFNFYSTKVQNETWRTAQTFFRHGGCTIEQKLHFSYYKIPVATYVLAVNYLSQIVLKYMQNSRKIRLRMCKRRNNIKQIPRGVKSVFEWFSVRVRLWKNVFQHLRHKASKFPAIGARWHPGDETDDSIGYLQRKVEQSSWLVKLTQLRIPVWKK